MELNNLNIKVAGQIDIKGCSRVDKQMGFATKSSVFEDAVKNKRLIIAKVESRIVGYLRYGYLWEHRLPYVQVIRVIKTFRGKGVGKELLQTAGTYFKKLGFPYILSSTDQDNLISLLFHKRLGFEKIGVLKFPLSFQNQPEVFLIKKL